MAQCEREASGLARSTINPQPSTARTRTRNLLDMKLYAVRIFTTDWDRSVDFYQETIGLPLTFIDQTFAWAEFDLGGARLGIEAVDANAPNAEQLVGRFVGVSLTVDDIDLVYAQLLDKGVEFTAPPEKQPWGGALAHFKDPDNNILTLFGA